MSDEDRQCDTEFQSSQNSFDDPESFNSASADSYNQPIHSLLLCPAQWTALLESSPISLVRQQELRSGPSCSNEKDYHESYNHERGEEMERNNSDKMEEEPMEKFESLQEDRDPYADESEEEENMNEHQFAAQIKEEEEEERTLLKTRCDGNKLPLPQFGGNGSLLASDESSDTTCVLDARDELMIRQEALVAPAMAGCDSDRGSAPHTPLSESKLPLSYLTTFSHSRNISETPSLPPYISSSTSSAYHSRNSSMASQITLDCFDSDSQFTDIDSCIVLQNGVVRGGPDRPVSLQDGRYKFPDVPAEESTGTGSSRRGCYSVCDLSPGKVRMPDHIIVTSPVILEDTLRQTTLTGAGSGCRHPVGHPEESFEVKHEASALKSSEWIKRVMSGQSRQSMVHVKVSSKTKHVVHFNVKAGDLIIWEFATKRKDIGLGLSFEATEVATVESPELTDEPPQKKMTSILPILRVNSHTRPVIGSHTATQDGVYEIIFDNSYSRFFAKELFYRITTQPSVPNENYLNQ